jgi:hypothetical protein
MREDADGWSLASIILSLDSPLHLVLDIYPHEQTPVFKKGTGIPRTCSRTWNGLTRNLLVLLYPIILDLLVSHQRGLMPSSCRILLVRI